MRPDWGPRALYKISLRSDEYFRSYRRKTEWDPRELTPYDFLDAPHSLHVLSKTAGKTCAKFHYGTINILEVIARKQNGTPRELTPYDILDASYNLYAFPKTASNTCTKFHYDPRSISGAIAKNRCATP